MSTKALKMSLNDMSEDLVDMDDMEVVEGEVVEANDHLVGAHQGVEIFSNASSEGNSSSRSSNTSNDSDGESSSDDNNSEDDAMNVMEAAQLTDNGTVLELPRQLCEHASIFHEFFKPEIWTAELSEQERKGLQKYLPRFQDFLEPDEAMKELENTVFQLLGGTELHRFGHVPMADLQKNLEAGNYRPDVLLWRRSIAKSKRREQRFQECERISQLSKKLFVSREKLLRQAYKLAPEEPFRLTDGLTKRLAKDQRLQTTLSGDMNVWSMRGRKRYHTILEELTKDVLLTGEEDISNDDSDIVSSVERQIWHEEQQNTLKSVISFSSTSASANDRCIFDTFFKRRNDLPDDDAIRVMQYGKRPRLSNRNIREYLKEHKRLKLIKANAPEFETADIRLRDVCGRAQVGGDDNFKRIIAARKSAAAARRAKQKAAAAMADSSLDPASLVQGQNIGNDAVNALSSVTTVAPTGAPPAMAKQQSTSAIRPVIVNMSEPPALVPIQPAAADIYANKQIKKLDAGAHLAAARLSDVQQNLPLSASDNSAAFDIEDVVPFDINDFDVDLQQEEVETYDGPAATSGHQVSAGQSTNNQAIFELPKLKPLTSASPLKTAKPSLANKTISQRQQSAKGKASANTSKTLVTPGGQVIAKLESCACFFSLIRDIFCAAPNHRMKCDELKRRINALLSNPSTALNDWYTQVDCWQNLVESAIDFLAGDFQNLPDEYVPYIEFKTALNIYQWIGAGRDLDARLSALCNFWLKSIPTLLSAESHQSIEGLNNASIVSSEQQLQLPIAVTSPPPPRCPTTWTVRPATVPEILEFQRQERERFANPHKAYTYRMNGYDSVVGPVKNINSPALNKARGHIFMVGDRPNYITILNLVRDATARLPNGEGSRAEIAELLKCSQYINRDTSENTLQSVVSGALDRMHIEIDPCVRYEPKRKIWIYLHRDRSEEDFETAQQYQLQDPSRQQQLDAAMQNRKAATSIAGLPTAAAAVHPASSRKIVVSSVDAEDSLAIPNLTSMSTPMVLPALVPANSYLIASNNGQQQQQQRQQINPKATPPVPPLKYNVPANAVTLMSQQQQKSLLKTMQNIQAPRQVAAKRAAVSTTVMATAASGGAGTKLSSGGAPVQKIVRTVGTNSASSNAKSPPNRGSSSPTKQVTYSLAKSNAANAAQTNPMVVASSSVHLQQMHINNALLGSSAIIGSDKSVDPKIIGATTYMVGGKRVALSKPIIVNQIGTAPLTQHQQQQQQITNRIRVLKQNNAGSQKQSIGPVNSGSDSLQPQTTVQTIVIDPAASSANAANSLLSADNISAKQSQQHIVVHQATQQPSGATSRNVIRIMPGVKNIINISPGITSGPDNKNLKVSQATGNIGASKVIGQRLVGKANARPSPSATPTKTVGNFSIVDANTCDPNENAATTSCGTVLKMSPQAFNAIQHKGQHIIVKQGPSDAQKIPQNQQQHLVIGNTAIIAPGSGNQKLPKNIVVQQQRQQLSPTINATTSPAAGKPINKKIQINASSLSPEQQRALMQTLKQQQPAKASIQRQQQTVTFVSSGKTQEMPATLAQSMNTIGGTAKQVAVVVSQAQGFNKVLKTAGTSQQDQQQNTSNNKFALATGSSSTTQLAAGQIISLDELVQQQQRRSGTTPLLGKSSNNGQFTVVSQAPTSRIITFGTANNSATSSAASKVVAGTTTVSTAGSQAVQQLINVVSPAHARTSTAAGAAPIKVINAGGAGGGTVIAPNNFSIANIQGKQVVFATKSNVVAGSSATASGLSPASIKNIIPVSNNIIIGGQTIKLQGNQQIQTLSKVSTIGNTSNQSATSQVQPSSQQQLQTVIMGNQILRVLPQTFLTNAGSSNTVAVAKSLVGTQQQQPARIITAVANKSATSMTNTSATHTSSTLSNTPKALILGTSGATHMNSSQQIQLHTANATITQQNTHSKGANLVSTSGSGNTNKSKTGSTNNSNGGPNNNSSNRLVFAVQGGGQILLSPSQFQGGTLNLKSLQNIKLVSVAQLPQQTGGQQQNQEVGATQKPTPTIIKTVNASNSINTILQDGAHTEAKNIAPSASR